MSGWTAGAIVGGSLISGYLGSNATQSAANTQAQSAGQATALQGQEFNTLQNNMQPYMQAGSAALPRLQQAAGSTAQGYNPSFSYNPSQDPYYQFQLQQGTQNILNQSTAMGGGLDSGNTLQSLMQYGQGLAGQSYQQEFNNWLSQNSQALGAQGQQYQQLYGLAGMGQNAAAGVGQGAIQTGQLMGNNITGAGNAQAAAQIAQGNIWGSTAQQAFSPSNVNALAKYMSGSSPGYSDVTNGMGAYTYNGSAYNNPSAYIQ